MNAILREAWAVALRDFKRSTHRIKTIITLIIFLAVIIGIGLGLNSILKMPSIGNYATYFTTGILGYMFAMTGLAAGISLIMDKKTFSRLLLVAPIHRISILLGKMMHTFIASISYYFVAGIIVMIFFNLFSFLNLLFFIFALFIVLLLFMGIGFIISSFVNTSSTAQAIIQYASIGLLLLSGVLYPLQSLPKALQFLFYFNPLTYGIEAIRYAFTQTSAIPIGFVMSVLIILSLLCSVIGIYLYDYKLRG